MNFYVFLSFCLSSCPCVVLHEFWDNILRSSGLPGKHITYWTFSLYTEPFLSPQKHFSTNNRKQNGRTNLQIFVYLQWLLSLTGTRNWNIIHCLFSWLTNCNIISSTDKICNQVVKQLTIYHDFTRVLEVSRVLSTETKSR